MGTIAANLSAVRERIQESARRVNRDPREITLIAVTKYVTVNEVNEAIRHGVTDIGENRVQDACLKFDQLDTQVTRHLIGTLQTNKVRPALENFDLIHSVDRPELILEMARQAEKLDRLVPFLIQLNISGEETKHGAPVEDLPALLDQVRAYPRLQPTGLMTIAPLVFDPEETRPVFRRLREYFLAVNAEFHLGPSWRYLSMGMSQDFEIAIEEGANLIRVGSAIFR